MSNKKTANKFDALVETLMKEFSKIPNFDLTQKDEGANKLFNMVTFRISDLSSYRDLVYHQFVPAINKAAVLGKGEFTKSKYNIFLDKSAIDFDETLHDTIRLAYVGLFHKLEGYVNDLNKIPEYVFEDAGDIEKWVFEKYKFRIKDWKRFFITEKINWIANCVKHYDGFPKKIPKPDIYKYRSEEERLKFSPQDFKKDCEMLLEFYPSFMQIVFLFCFAKQFHESLMPSATEFGIKSLSLEKQELQFKSLDEQIHSLIENLNGNN